MKNKSPTNAQMERSDEIEARLIAAKKIREREIEGDTLRLPMAKSHRVVDPSKTGSTASGIRFDIPAARPFRLKTPSGARSFHFQHEPVTRSEQPSSLSDRHDRPGSPADHTKYIERASAVASLDPSSARHQTPSLSEFTSDDVARSAADQSAGQTPNPHDDARSTPEQRMNYHDCHDTPTTKTSAIGLEGLPIRQPDVERAGDGQPSEHSQPHADLWLLPNGELVCDTWEAPCPLLGDEEIPLDEGLGADFLRCPPQSDRPDRGAEPEYLAGVGGSEAARTDQYIIRPSAVAFQPDGTRALITNIDDDPEERVKFWNSVERHERKSSGDKMEFCVSNDPDFWNQVAAQPDCPPELFVKITGDDADSIKPISIKNGKEVRRFLSKQPGWEQGKRDISRDGKFPLAKFSDGRGGRVQYRIIAELPKGISMEAHLRIMKAFAHEFEKRGLPFIAVIHAPDEHNHHDNWHIHFVYWDRPCRKIDQDDIDSLSAKGFDTRQLKPGMWDFTCAVHKFDRTNRKSFPLRQNKVLEITRNKGWPKYLRRQFAQCVNEELELAGSQMRFDPRKYEEMDIPAVPQERLGPNDHAREVKGEITETGVSNEQKQWDAIKAKLKADHQRDVSAIDGELADLMRGLAQHPQVDEIKKRFKVVLQKAADLRYQLNIQEQELERQASRARFIYTRNRQVLDAHEARSSKLSRKKEREVRDLVEQAQAHLDQLELEQKPKREEIAKIRRLCDEKVLTLNAVAQQYRKRLAEMQQQARMAQEHSAASPEMQAGERGTTHQPSVKPAMEAKRQAFGPKSAADQPGAAPFTGTGDNPNGPRREPSNEDLLDAAKMFLKARGCRIFENADGSLHPEMVFWEGAGLDRRILEHPAVVDEMNKAKHAQNLFIDLYADICARDGDLASARLGAKALMRKIPEDRHWEMKAWLNTGLIEEVLIPRVKKNGHNQAQAALLNWNNAKPLSPERAAAAIEADYWQRRWPNQVRPDLLMQLEQEAKEARLQHAMEEAATDDGTSDQGSLGTHRDPDDALVKREREEHEKRLRVLEQQRRQQQGLER